jgi:hypothetical protein
MRSVRRSASPLVAVVAAAMTIAGPAATGTAASGPGAPRTWLTTGDQANLLSERSDRLR